MRQFKFRAWNNKNLKMIYNVSVLDSLAFKNNIHLPVAFGNQNYTIEQFTGLLDQAGNEIYEGDYFELKGGLKWFVEWQEDLCRFVLTTGFGYDTRNCVDLTCDEVYYLTIKGNKHQ